MPENPCGRWITKTGSNGSEFRVWEQGVPKIDPTILQCTAYLYLSREDAKGGVQAGGTAFLVAYPHSKTGVLTHLYAATAKHIIVNGRSAVIRLRTPMIADPWGRGFC